MRIFPQGELKAAMAYAGAGGQALHIHRFLAPGAPRCFEREVERGAPIAHLFDHDVEQLKRTANQLGVYRVVVGRRGEAGQHIDLCGAPLRRAEMRCLRDKARAQVAAMKKVKVSSLGQHSSAGGETNEGI